MTSFLSATFKKSVNAAILLLLGVSFSAALSTPWQTNKHGKVRLISLYDVAPTTGTLWFGLEHQTIPGWHVYWKDAGDAGYAPRLGWKGSRGFEIPEIHWPAPTRFILPGDLKAYGYEGHVVYPIEARISRWADQIHVEADVDYLTCSEPCVPYRYQFSFDIPVEKNAVVDEEAARLIEQFRKRVPPASKSDEQILADAPSERVIAEGELPSGASVPLSKLAVMALLAFVGGLILNVMPCVLPVLSIKLLGVLQQGGRARSGITLSALASAAGIIASFVGLALVAVAFKQAGHAVGWGTQFQNPWFVGVLFIVVLAFGLNMWGFFEIPMPRAFGSLAYAGQSGDGLLPHFLSGLFATLLATPCSAPFLGTAMGFALAQSSVTIVLLFAAAGIGMAVPYFVLALFPDSIRLLPRPGVWMSKVRVILGVFLFATAAWLGWVLYQQIRSPQAASAPVEGKLAWQAFDENAIETYRSEGKTVFVDITADWCFTCKYNEKFVLASKAVHTEFERQGVVLMQADWTRRDEAIGKYLMKHGRAGIPFAAVYHPGRDPIVLPEFLTEKVVLNALSR